jgi:predicted nucleic acid-binding Zn ribbon protein
MKRSNSFGVFYQFRCLNCGTTIPSHRDFCSKDCEEKFFEGYRQRS